MVISSVHVVWLFFLTKSTYEKEKKRGICSTHQGIDSLEVIFGKVMEKKSYEQMAPISTDYRNTTETREPATLKQKS